MLYDQFFIEDLKSRADLVQRIMLIAVFLFALATSIVAQESPKAILVDRIRKPYCEDLLRSLDQLAAEATQASGYGVVAIHLGQDAFENAAYERAIRNNSVFRSFPAGLIRTVRMESKGEEPMLEFWRSTGQTETHGQDVPLSYVVNIPSRKRVVEDSLEVYRYDGKLDFGVNGCTGTFNLDVLANILASNPQVSAEVIVFNKTRSGARRLSSLIRKSARSEHQIPDRRLKIVLGGKGVAKEWAANVSAVEIWLVPSKRK